MRWGVAAMAGPARAARHRSGRQRAGRAGQARRAEDRRQTRAAGARQPAPATAGAAPGQRADRAPVPPGQRRAYQPGAWRICPGHRPQDAAGALPDRAAGARQLPADSRFSQGPAQAVADPGAGRPGAATQTHWRQRAQRPPAYDPLPVEVVMNTQRAVIWVGFLGVSAALAWAPGHWFGQEDSVAPFAGKPAPTGPVGAADPVGAGSPANRPEQASGDLFPTQQWTRPQALATVTEQPVNAAPV
ncbi:protein of unknown function, partial [Pseudomonas inefficax]